ncbi:MAG: hypothetical protein QG559_1500 [Campylobacterota bacterium]|nr:hypothetical protein [Campylobacterota bacterium]
MNKNIIISALLLGVSVSLFSGCAKSVTIL